MSKIIVKEKEITITKINEDDYISLTDIAKIRMMATLIWLLLVGFEE